MPRDHRLWTLLAPIWPSSRPGSPSRALMAGALAGLLGAATPACDDSDGGEPDPVVRDAGADAAADATAPDGAAQDGSTADAALALDGTAADGATQADAAPAGPVVTREIEGNRTYAEITAECDRRGGYTQIHAACAGVNSCAGFSYGDWDPGVTTEHTCAGINGCNGISCVVLPTDQGRTGKQIYEAELPETGPRSCTNCHAEWIQEGTTWRVDATKFKVYFMPGESDAPDGRSIANWKDKRPAAEQARMVAFGVTGRLPGGAAVAHMSPYHKLFSRAEIERVVTYVREQLTPVAKTYKISD